MPSLRPIATRAFADAFLLQFAPVEPSAARFAPRGLESGLTPQKPQKAVPLLREPPQPLPRTARVFAGNHPDVTRDGLRITKAGGIAEEHFGGKGGDRPHAWMRHQATRVRPFFSAGSDLFIQLVDLLHEFDVQRD